MHATFRVAVSRDLLGFYDDPGLARIGLDALDAMPEVEWEFLAEDVGVLRADQLRDVDGLLLLDPQVTVESLKGAGRLAIVARFGVGFDNVDLQACSENETFVTITPEGVRRPMAVAALTFVLALSQHVLVKDRLIRAGRWDDRGGSIGIGLTGRTVGAIGLGNIGRDFFGLLEPFAVTKLAFDPYATAVDASSRGVELVTLEHLLRESDFVVVMCPLTPETRHLIDASSLELMKPTAFLVNVARGPIVDQAALTEALERRLIAGAGLDVFEQEPIRPDDPLLALENVVLTPHAIGSTDECLIGCGRGAVAAILSVARGEVPAHVVNRDMLSDDRRLRKLERLAARAPSVADH